jgi:methionyl-tRNA synthetase
MTNYFITTAIPYINAKPHIGHVQEFLLTNQLVRNLKAQGHSVLWQSGTDDNSLKNLEAAQRLNLPIEDYLTTKTQEFKDLFTKLNLQPDYLVNTSSEGHKAVVQEFIKKLKPEDLYVNSYQGYYCVGCEDFIKDHELIKGVCPDHKTTPSLIKEENVYFKLSRYQNQIKTAITSGRVKFFPKTKEKEILSFLDSGLHDISISRPGINSSLGVDFPGYPDHKVYVWIDALINYLSGIDYFNGGQKIWDESYKIHVIGKNIWKFHAIYWLGLLLSADIKLPEEILIHGFLTVNGDKISKSLGNGGDLDLLTNNYSANELGLFLLGKNNYQVDYDFSEVELSKIYLQELVGQISNLFPRVWTIAQKSNFTLTRIPTKINHDFRELQGSYQNLLILAQNLNKKINDTKPWTLDLVTAQNHLIAYNQDLNLIADYLSLWFPELADKINNSFQEKVLLFAKK